jgi:pectin methylesterase-like acyl-CoA thioesterase
VAAAAAAGIADAGKNSLPPKGAKGTNRIIGGPGSARPKLQPQRAQRAQSKKEFFVFSAFSAVKNPFR